MYLHIGENTVVNEKNLIGIFDLDNTSISKHTRDFLKRMQQNGCVENVSYELPRSFVVCSDKKKATVYITQISSLTLAQRAIKVL